MTLLELFALLKKHLKLVISLPIACALATAVFSWAFLPNTYTSTVSMYVLTRANENTSVLTSTDLTASQMLTNDVATLIKSDRIESDTASKLQMDSLKGYDVRVSSETTTRVITVSVTGKSAQATAIVAKRFGGNRRIVLRARLWTLKASTLSTKPLKPALLPVPTALCTRLSVSWLACSLPLRQWSLWTWRTPVYAMPTNWKSCCPFRLLAESP